MKNFLLVSALVGVLILTGCSQQKGLSQDELFEKKKECADLRKNMEQDLKKRFPIAETTEATIYFHEVFYSEIINSCIYYGERARKDSNDFVIVDYLENKEILRIDGYNIDEVSDNGYKMIQAKLKELKGE